MAASDWHHLRDSVVEARHACRFALRRRDVGFAAHESLASHAVLLAMQPDPALSHFEEALLRTLSQYDATNHSDLVATLENFLSSGGHYQETADHLHVHVNTLRQRLARISALTGRDLTRMDDRVDFWLALQARDLRAENARSTPNG
jgi:DNA-binding PucR family transcriptional regulator